jgi:hypothetical protein
MLIWSTENSGEGKLGYVAYFLSSWSGGGAEPSN